MKKIKLKTEVSIDGRITQKLIMDNTHELSRCVFDTEDESIKEALISLGWRPPK